MTREKLALDLYQVFLGKTAKALDVAPVGYWMDVATHVLSLLRAERGRCLKVCQQAATDCESDTAARLVQDVIVPRIRALED